MSGIVNYDGAKPTYAYSGETTQFEDALMKHGVITKEQALLNKGMDEESVRDLLLKEEVDKQIEKQGGVSVDYFNADKNKASTAKKAASEDGDGDGSDSDGEDDDAFLQSYRASRLQELQKSTSPSSPQSPSSSTRGYGSVLEIARPDWQREVNDASLDGRWVAVLLVGHGSSECRLVEDAVTQLAEKFKTDVKFVKIRSEAAIQNWPEANLPTLFFYRDGELQKQCVGTSAVGGPGTNVGRLEWRMKLLGVLPGSEMTEDVEKNRIHVTQTSKLKMGEGERKGMAMLDTYGESDDEDVGAD